MKYILTPLNEGHEMPCSTTLKTNKVTALAVAKTIAVELHEMLPGNDFACRLQRADGQGEIFRAWPNGRLINEKTGEEVPRAIHR